MVYRSNLSGTLTQSDVEEEVVLAGWVDVRRDLGGIIFIELRDHSGRVQLICDPQLNPQVHHTFEQLRPEFCIQVAGKVRTRPEGTENPELRSGAIEVVPHTITILNTSRTLPLPLKDFNEADESFRLKHRYLDLRRDEMQTCLRTRHKIAHQMRSYLVNEGYLEIETPILTRATPEGARDYLVPSRVHPGEFYALPQSPQLFKQILMASGFEKYFQFARCFRDEDLRADRQPEFTQIDIEQSFATMESVLTMAEELVKVAFQSVGKKFSTPLRRMSYAEAMLKYGSDKPDLRFGLTIVDFTNLMKEASFEAFAKIACDGGVVRGICVPETAGWSRKDFDDLRSLAMTPEYGAKGLAWITYKAGEDPHGSSPITKFFTPDQLLSIREIASAKDGSSVFFVADSHAIVAQALGRLRLHLGERLGLIDNSRDELLWIVDWPLLEVDPASGGMKFLHHPFTAVHPQDEALLDSRPEHARALAYDIVCNGIELGGGSIRSHTEEAQLRALNLIGMGREEAERRFGFLMNALAYGAPPHGGIAIGFDRLVMMLSGAQSIRGVLAFPKMQSAACPLTGAPSSVDNLQLRELHIRTAQRTS